MFENFTTYITGKVSLSEEEVRKIQLLSKEKKYRRRQLLLHEGEICRQKIFVAKGLLRNYCKKDDGSEYIMRFTPENHWTMDPESYNSQIPSRYNIEALEDTVVLVWSKESMDELFATIPAFKSYSERLIASTLDASQNRVLMNISYTAQEKYREFVSSYPDVFRRVPLHMVASYLGVSRETLSRIRQAQPARQK